MSISVLILTLNEERNLPACLDSVRWCDDIVVLDSLSSDKTVEIANECRARVVQKPFDNWAAHQNWALENIHFRHQWVFYLDADERMTDELYSEIKTIAASPKSEIVAYYCGRRNFFFGRWIRHAMPPGMILRFFRPDFVRFERLVNPIPIIRGPHGYLKNLFDHHNFSKGIAEWIDKHNKYSTLEAIEGLKIWRGQSAAPSLWSKDAATRRKALKHLSFRLPCRPLLKFVYMYLLKHGFLDGYPGFAYCVLQAMYEYMIVLKMREIERLEKGWPT